MYRDAEIRGLAAARIRGPEQAGEQDLEHLRKASVVGSGDKAELLVVSAPSEKFTLNLPTHGLSDPLCLQNWGDAIWAVCDRKAR